MDQKTPKINLLIVEDDEKMIETLRDILEEEYIITEVSTVSDAKKEIDSNSYDLALVDIKLPDGTGLDILDLAKQKDISTIILAGFASVDNTIYAFNKGAFAYIRKPCNPDELKLTLTRAYELKDLLRKNKQLIVRLKDLSLKDMHTGLYNYRYLRERLEKELQRAKRYIFPLSVLMIDIDYFKSINDVYGHQYGDYILKLFADQLNSLIRGSDVVSRYGGEEFLIILSDTNKDGAVLFAERLAKKIKNHVFDPNDKKVQLKVSIGVASFPEDGQEVCDLSGILKAVDFALARAKEDGGDEIVCFKALVCSSTDSPTDDFNGSIDSLSGKLSRMEKRISQALWESINAFARTIETKDYSTGEHCKNMTSLVGKICQKLSLPEEETEAIKRAGYLHDLGKIGIPERILNKDSFLTEKEKSIIKKHPQIGAEIIRPVHFLRESIPIILYHHERFDGLGYSAGLKGKTIPLGARIVAVVDVYEALVCDRPYRKVYSKEEAIKIIAEGSGTQFDPKIVKVFLEVINQNSEEV